MKIKSLWLAAIAATLLAACDGGSTGNGGSSSGGGDDSGDSGGGDVPPLAVTDSPEIVSGASAPALRGDREPLDVGRYLQLLRNDLNAVSRSQQSELVYLDFHAAYNNQRFANADLQALADATLELLNRLDVEPAASGTSSVSAVLDQNSVPVGVRFNPARFHLDRQKDVNDIVVRLSNRDNAANAFPCDVPAIPVLDFLNLVSSNDKFNPAGALGTSESASSSVALKKLLVKAQLLSEGQVASPLVDVTPGDNDDSSRGCVLGGASDVGDFGDE